MSTAEAPRKMSLSNCWLHQYESASVHPASWPLNGLKLHGSDVCSVAILTAVDEMGTEYGTHPLYSGVFLVRVTLVFMMVQDLYKWREFQGALGFAFLDLASRDRLPCSMEGVNTRIGRATRLAFQHCEGNSPVASRSRQRATSYAHSRAPIPPRASPLWAAHRSQRFCAALAVPTERTAVVIDRDTPPDALRLSSIYVPDCHDDELLVEVHAAGVNALDWFIAKAVQKIPRFARQAPGFVPGKDISGVVVGVGSGVTEFKEGDEVFGMTGFGLSPQAIARVSADNLSRGAYATYTTIKAGITAKKPPNLTHVQAAAIPLASLAAWKAIVGAAKLQEGSKVVILNAAGGVGTMATQLAKRCANSRMAGKQQEGFVASPDSVTRTADRA